MRNSVKIKVLFLISTLVQLCGLYNVLIGLIGMKHTHNQLTPIPTTILPLEESGSAELAAEEEIVISHHGTTSNKEITGLTYLPSMEYAEFVHKIGIIIIDAMRVDFLYDYDLPFVNSLLENSYGCVYISNVKTPTVTLPRIKSLVTGDISSYWDIIQNFYSSRLEQDNFIWRARKEKNKTIVFYGDDTWIKLFPTEFQRSEGVSSFYVNDFYEVDNNVTKNFHHELSQNLDWDMLILHYLGLDHIGHVHGLKQRKLLQEKLLEMDEVIKKFYEGIKNSSPMSQKADDQNILPSYLIITGDHGMADIGGHGSSSQPEITTPLIILSTEAQKCSGRSSGSNWSKSQAELPVVEQTDFATTIALLWGLHIPSSSLGKLISSLPSNNIESYLFAMHYNAIHLRNLLKSIGTNGDLLEFDARCQEVFNSHLEFLKRRTGGTDMEDFNGLNVQELKKSYELLLGKLSSRAIDRTVSEQNVIQICIGLVLLIYAYILVLIGFSSSTCTNVLQFFTLRTLILSLTVLATAYLTFTTVFNAAPTAEIFALSFLVLLLLYLLTSNRKLIVEIHNNIYHQVNSSLILLIHIILPFFLYFSSSFIEEEHFIRYFIWTSLIIIQFMNTAKTKNLEYFLLNLWTNIGKIWLMLTIHRIAMNWNSTGQKWANLPSIVDYFGGGEGGNVLYWLVLLILGLVIPTIFYLRSKSSSRRLGILYFASIIAVTLIKFMTTSSTTTSNGHQHYFLMMKNEILERIGFGIIVIQFIVGKYYFTIQQQSQNKSNLVNSWILFLILTYKLKNIVLIGFEYYQLELLQSVFFESGLLICKKSCNSLLDQKILLFIWFGWTSFYYQGNSNNIASVDISTGYIGQTSYNEFLVGTLIFLNIYSAPIFQAIMVLESSSTTTTIDKFTDITNKGGSSDLDSGPSSASAGKKDNEDHDHDGGGIRTRTTTSRLRSNNYKQHQKKQQTNNLPSNYFPYLCLLTCYNSIIYSTAILCFHQHLFVWTVFTPKLLYVIGYTGLISIHLLVVIICEVFPIKM